MAKTLNVLYQSDNNYAELTGVSIVSLYENNKHIENLNVYLLNDNISRENLELMKITAKNYNREITIVETKEILERLIALKVEPYKNTYTTYFKLFAINQLKLPTNRLLQLDGDTIINQPLDELIDMDIDHCVCAATYASILNDYKKCVNIPENDKYYNCGVLLINTDFWKEYECEEKIVYHLTHERNRYFIVDQDIINVLFRDKIKYLHLKYNFNSGYYIYGIDGSIKIYNFKDAYYSSRDLIEEAYQKPYIYHCMGAMTGRPWEQDNIHPQNDLYDKYLEMSVWKDKPKKIVRRSFMFRMQRRLYLLLPLKLYIPIHKIALKNYVNKMNKSVQKHDK